MHTSAPPIVPSQAKDRFDVYRFFNGISSEGKDGLDTGRTRIPLVKTYLLEHVSSRSGRTPRSAEQIFRGLGADVRSLDETFHEVGVWQKGNGNAKPKLVKKGYVEQYDERFFAYHTAEKAQEARQQVGSWVRSSSELDFAWFSGHLLQSLWNGDVSTRGDERFGRLVFQHESIFDMPHDEADDVDDEDGSDEDVESGQMNEDDRPEYERRRIRSEIKDRIGAMREVLGSLQDKYSPLNALSGLRIPSSATRGSHDLYYDGRITNRSDSFEDHRNTARYLYKTYKGVLERTEESAWFAFDEQAPVAKMRASAKGVPLIIHFAETLSEATFNRWISLAFRKRNAFRLWGDPVRLGPTKVHVYGADRHLWQPINLEMTERRLVAILPKGTCGNTFHRLVTNVQQYVCPKVDVWLGSHPFKALMDQCEDRNSAFPQDVDGPTPRFRT